MTIFKRGLFSFGALALGVCACGSSGTSSGPGGCKNDGSGGFCPFTPPADPGPRSVLFTASGEELAYTGYPFPPAADGDPAFVDGWQIDFTRLIVTIDKITLSDGPNDNLTDQTVTPGKLVAQLDGPWAVDLHKQGPLLGKGGGLETAVPIAGLTKQNMNGDSAFNTSSGATYAFGFDLVAANPISYNVNLDEAGVADYASMVTDGCAVLYVGTATFNGTDCAPADPTFAAFAPTVGTAVDFRFCFKSPTSYVNCQDGSNNAQGINGEEHPRGFAFKDNQSVTAQVTVHTDHPFWDSTIHDSPAHFDQFAAQTAGTPAPAQVSLDDVIGVDYLAFRNKAGAVLPFRTCLPKSRYPQGGYDAPAGQLNFTAQGIGKSVDPTTGFRDYYDFTTYNQSTQGHLNSDGLCGVVRHYPSPP